jgi:hypothetical protein
MFKKFKKLKLLFRIGSGTFLIGLVGYTFEKEVQDGLRAELYRRPRTSP